MDHKNADRFVKKMNQINEDLQQQMCLAQAIYEDFVNCWWCSVPTYQVGDEVWLNTWNLPLKGCSSQKLSVKYQGPYQILKIVSSHVYHLAIPNNFEIHNVFHTNLLRSVADDPLSNQIPPVPFPHVVKVEQDTDRLKHHQVFSIANIQDEAQRRKQGTQMHQRKLCSVGHMIWVGTTILQGPHQWQYYMRFNESISMFKEPVFMFNKHYMNHKSYCDISSPSEDCSSHKVY